MLIVAIVVALVLLLAAPFVRVPRWLARWGAHLAFWQRQSVRDRLRQRRPLLLTYAGLAGAGLMVLVIWVLPSLLTKHPHIDKAADRQTAITNTRGNLALLLAGLGAVSGLAFTARTYRLSQTGQLTDRYSKAVEQLGSDQIEVRLGGIYALERLMRDSPADQPTILETLAAFVRQHAPRMPAPTSIKRGRRVLGRRSVTASLRNGLGRTCRRYSPCSAADVASRAKASLTCHVPLFAVRSSPMPSWRMRSSRART